MIESLHTHVAIVTVGGVGWPENITHIAEFHLTVVSLCWNCVENWLSVRHAVVHVILSNWDPRVLFTFVSAEYFWDDPRVHAS